MSTTTIDPGTVVEIYRNIHKSRAAGRAVYSVRDAKSKKVIGHEGFIVLADAVFKVSEAGRQRVLREQKKNVHAVVQGTWIVPGTVDMPGTAVAISYNPYRFATFVATETTEPVRRADVVELGQGVLAWGITS